MAWKDRTIEVWLTPDELEEIILGLRRPRASLSAIALANRLGRADRNSPSPKPEHAPSPIDQWMSTYGRRFWREPLVHVAEPLEALARAVQAQEMRIQALEATRGKP